MAIPLSGPARPLIPRDLRTPHPARRVAVSVDRLPRYPTRPEDSALRSETRNSNIFELELELELERQFNTANDVRVVGTCSTFRAPPIASACRHAAGDFSQQKEAPIVNRHSEPPTVKWPLHARADAECSVCLGTRSVNEGGGGRVAKGCAVQCAQPIAAIIWHNPRWLGPFDAQGSHSTTIRGD